MTLLIAVLSGMVGATLATLLVGALSSRAYDKGREDRINEERWEAARDR